MTKGLERILQEWFANAISTSDRFILGFYIKELYVKPINPKSSGRNNCVSPSRTGLSSGTKCRPFYKSRPKPNRIQSPSAGRSTGRSVTDPRKTEIHRNILSLLDEFFMIRVSGLKEQMQDAVVSPDSIHPKKLLKGIRKSVQEMSAAQSSCLINDIFPALEEKGVTIVKYDSLPSHEREA